VAATASTGGVLLRYSATGALDTTFGTAGIATLAGVNLVPTGVLVQPDGRSILVGTKFGTPGSATNPSFVALARFDDAGALDTSFATNGVATIASPVTTPVAGAVLQADGTILLTTNTAAGGGLRQDLVLL